MCTAASSPADRIKAMDWDKYKRKLGADPEALAEIQRQQQQFEDRRTAAAKVGKASAEDIDWDGYAARLPGVDLAALKADFAAFLSSIPAVTYDEGGDAKAHADKEETARKLQALSRARLGELEALDAEAADHAMHEHYSANDMYLRHEGLHDAIQSEILDREYFRDVEPQESTGVLTDEAETDLLESLLAKGGLSSAELRTGAKE